MKSKNFTSKFFNNDPINPNAVIIYVSLILFLLRLYACRYIVPDFNGMDYYGYIELAKNILHKLDFTVRWELDSPIQYPPFFSILIYSLSYLTKDPVASIQYISIFCASFYLVPLFSLVRNILNIYFAILAVVFTTYYFGIVPCHMLTMDFFYSFLIIIICWLLWDTLTNRSRQAVRYVIIGVLISIAYLTKYSGILFGYASMASILYYFARYQQSLKAGLKYCAFLLVGAAPLFITYHLLLDNNPKKEVPSIAAYAFFDGNYLYEKGWYHREERISELNPEGTEFAYVTLLKTTDEFKFFLKEPSFVFDKYMWGLNKMTQEMTFTLLPGVNIEKSKFYKIDPDGDMIINLLSNDGWNSILREISSTEVRINPGFYLTKDVVRKVVGNDFEKVWNILRQSLNSRRMINIVFQGTFLFLLIIGGVYFKWNFNLTHVLFFTISMVLIPIYFVSERYLMPFMPLYFVLWLFIANACYGVIRDQIKDKIFLKNMVSLIFISLVLIYFTNSYKQINQMHRYFRYEEEQSETWLQTVSWIKKDSISIHKRIKIMSSYNYASYLTDSDYIRLPFLISNWDKLLNFAVLKKVDYIVIEGDHSDSFFRFSEDEFRKTMTPQALISIITSGSKKIDVQAGILATATSLESLNRLLEYRGLYQIMKIRPAESIRFIRRLIQKETLTILEITQLNRLLIEANYPNEAPHKLLLNSNRYAGPGHITAIHDIIGKNDIFWIIKI